jgi:16S rRNA processing protein RimM
LPSSSSSGDDLVIVGRVGKPHGLDGSFVVEGASDEPARFAVDAEIWVGGEPARVVASRRARGRPVIRLDRPVERGTRLEVPTSLLPSPEQGSYYVFQLVGLEVEEEGGRPLGRVADVAPGVANDVLELDSGLALPMHEDCISEVDLAAGKIVVAPGFADDHKYLP